MLRSSPSPWARILGRSATFLGGLVGTLLGSGAYAQGYGDHVPLSAPATPQTVSADPAAAVSPPVVPTAESGNPTPQLAETPQVTIPTPQPVVTQQQISTAPLSIWRFDLGGYVHAAYRWIEEPQNYNLAGRNNGFQLEQARVSANVQYKSVLAGRVSIEGASEDRLSQSFPGGQLTARLRDAYITWAPLRFLRVSIGQMVTPWDLDSMRSDAELPFVSRAVPVEGVQPTEGYTTRGMGADRNLGISIHSGHVPLAGNTSFRYSLFAGNGNGQNQLLSDNNIPAVRGRAEFSFWGKEGLPIDQVRPMYAVTDDLRKPIVHIGVAAQWNPRTVGNLPDLIKETDVGVAADFAGSYLGIELQAAVLYVKTTRDTLSAIPPLERFGWWAHLRYTIPKIPLEVTPGYRVASYAPRAHYATTPISDTDRQFDESFALLYHTFGVFVRPTRTFPVHVSLNYTLTSEQSPNILNNDRFEADIVAAF